MDVNPYAPPGAAVADVIAPGVFHEEPPFFAVSLLKLLLMSICTFGLYELFWFSRQWKAIEKRECRSLNPYLRSVLSIYFCYSCFARIRDYGVAGKGSTLWAGPLSIGFALTIVAAGLPMPWATLTVLQPLFVLIVQRRANQINAAVTRSYNRNDTFSAWNWVALIVGGLFQTADVIGALYRVG